MSAPTWDPLSQQTPEAVEKLHDYASLLLTWNRRVNLVSRRASADDIWRHIVHCLTLTCRSFPRGSTVVDWGSGGGLPAIPLAIAFPGVAFHAVDAVEKKILAVRAMARELDLDNVTAHHARAESWTEAAQYSVSRATASLRDLVKWHGQLTEAPPGRARSEGIAQPSWTPGLHCLKGGDLAEEISACRRAFPAAAIETLSIGTDLGCADYADKVIVSVTFPEIRPR